MKAPTRRGFRWWLLAIGVAVVAAFVVPYAIFSRFPPSLAVYGFWTAFGFVVAGLIYWGVKEWSDAE